MGTPMTVNNAQVRSYRTPIIILTIITALVHFSRAVADPEIRALFILNGIGYLVLVTLLYLPSERLTGWRSRIRWILIVYAGITILLYFVWGLMSGEWVVPLGPIDKLVEIALIVLLWLEARS